MRYYIIAGEASGDLHGANLMKALYALDPTAEIRFWGGDAMQKVGGTMVRHIKELAYMGFLEVAMHLKTVMGNINYCKHDLLQYRPDAVIYVDYPGFNLKIAKFAHTHGFKNFHYISPQVWAWKKGRLGAMRRDLDALYYILPFEQTFYQQNHFPQASFVGHPLLDAIEPTETHDKPTDSCGRHYVALLPGSRKHELKKMLPMMVDLARRHSEYHFLLAGMSLIGEDYYRQIAGTLPENVAIVYDNTYSILRKAHAAIVKSGTSTLETALFGVPQVVCYRANAVSIAIARRLVGSRIRYISLVNLIADKAVVCELIQDDMNAETLECEFQKIATDATLRQQIANDYNTIRQRLGNHGASQRTAQAILDHLTP